MSAPSQDTQNPAALDMIAKAFADRAQPATMTDSLQLSDVEFDEVMSFEGMDWRDIEFDQIEQQADAVFWFSPKAFCYYLPGFLSAGIEEDRCDSNAYDSLIGMLDRSPEPDHWDDFFAPRWTLLSAAEIEAVGVWVRWFHQREPDAFQRGTYERVSDTLTLLTWKAEEAAESS